METTTSKPNMAKKPRVAAGKTRVGRPTPAANESLPLVPWVLPMQAILKGLEDLSFAAGSVQDVDDGSDILASRLGILAGTLFKNISLAIEQGLRNSTTLLDRLFDAQAMIRGAQAVDVNSPNREAINCLILSTIEAVTETENRDGFDDAALAQILAGLPNPDKVPPVQPEPKNEAKTEQKTKPTFITRDTPMSLNVNFGRILALDATYDIEGAALQLIRRSRELDLPPEDGAELRSIGVRIKDLNSMLMSSLGDDDVQSLGDAHHLLFRGAVPFPEGVEA